MRHGSHGPLLRYTCSRGGSNVRFYLSLFISCVEEKAGLAVPWCYALPVLCSGWLCVDAGSSFLFLLWWWTGGGGGGGGIIREGWRVVISCYPFLCSGLRRQLVFFFFFFFSPLSSGDVDRWTTQEEFSQIYPYFFSILIYLAVLGYPLVFLLT